MKQVTVNVPDTQFQFFIQLIDKLNFSIEKQHVEIDIPEAHKNLIRQRVATSKDEDFTEWETARKNLKVE